MTPLVLTAPTLLTLPTRGLTLTVSAPQVTLQELVVQVALLVTTTAPA